MPPTQDDVLQAMPEGGLFAGKAWLTSPEPFAIEPKLVAELQKLGHRLHVFLKVANDLYYRSVKGKAPPWIAGYLDAGKPAELLEAARAKPLRNQLPGVIRPDLILTESGFAMSEIDSASHQNSSSSQQATVAAESLGTQVEDFRNLVVQLNGLIGGRSLN